MKYLIQVNGKKDIFESLATEFPSVIEEYCRVYRITNAVITISLFTEPKGEMTILSSTDKGSYTLVEGVLHKGITYGMFSSEVCKELMNKTNVQYHYESLNSWEELWVR